MSSLRILSLVTTVSLAAGAISALPSLAKRPITITQRQEALQRDISKDEKSNELTKKEADGLRSDLQDIANKINKMKAKNGNKLAYKDEGKIEKDLNGVSLHLKKLELNKRVDAK